MKILIFSLSFLLLFLTPATHAQMPSAPPVMVELFTAENCPACPPADAYLKKLAGSQNVIALACHVDYFPQGRNNLGQKFCTKRQAVYIARMGKKKWFTPHMMINGHVSEVGNKTSKVAAKVSKAQKDNLAPIYITEKVNGVFEFTMPHRNITRPSQIWMAVYNKPTRGQGRAASREFVNVVQSMTPQGVWQGDSYRRAFYPILNQSSGGIVMFAEDSASGRIIAAGEVRFN